MCRAEPAGPEVVSPPLCSTSPFNFSFLCSNKLLLFSYIQLHDCMDCSTTGFPVLDSLLKPMSIESVLPSNHLLLCRPLLLMPSVFLSIRVFSKESVFCIRWPKYWSFSMSPSNEYSVLISFSVELTGLISLQSKGLSRVFSNTKV